MGKTNAGACILGAALLFSLGCEERRVCLCALDQDHNADSEPDYTTCGSPLKQHESLHGPDTSSFDEAAVELATQCVRGLLVLRGECADGKQFLHVNGGFTTETRYYAGGQLVGASTSTDILDQSICPVEHFYGSLETVRCEAAMAEQLCANDPDAGAVEELFLPFADGRPLGSVATTSPDCCH